MKTSLQAKFKPLIDLLCAASENTALTKQARRGKAKGKDDVGSEVNAAWPQAPLLFPQLLSLHITDCPKLLAVDLVCPLLCECTFLKCTLLERASLTAPEVLSVDCTLYDSLWVDCSTINRLHPRYIHTTL
jgi:hypothetical protein